MVEGVARGATAAAAALSFPNLGRKASA